MPESTESLNDPRPRATAADPVIAMEAQRGVESVHGEFDWSSALDDARAYVQSHPVQALAGAAALGFLLAVAMRRT